jgi:LacI family transcriptional regulator
MVKRATVTGGKSRAPTVADVAKAAGVGVGTVSRVINSRGAVSADARNRVLQAIADVGFEPNAIAQSLRSQSTKVLACIIRDLSVPVLAMFIDSMQEEADPRDYATYVTSSYHSIDREIELLRRFERRRVDGLVITTSSEIDTRLLYELRRVKFPVVLLDRSAPAEFDSVLIGHASGTYAGVRSLLDLGHRRIGFIGGRDAVHSTRDRQQGFEDAFRSIGLQSDPELTRTASFAPEFGYQAAAELLSSNNPPTALFAAGTSLLPGVLRAARERKMAVPTDLSVLAGADSELAEFAGISAVSWNHADLGRAAAELLFRRMADQSAEPAHLSFPTAFISRRSYSAPRSQR